MEGEDITDRGEKSVKDWIQFSTIITAAILTLYALIWQMRPTDGIVLISYLIFISFPFFANTISANSKVNKYIRPKPREVSDTQITRMINYAEFSFGFGFTLVISALAVLGYEYLKDYTLVKFPHLKIMALALPIVFLIIVWLLCFGYSIADSPKNSKIQKNETKNREQVVETKKGKDKKEQNLNNLKKLKRPVYISVEIVFMVLIILDYIGVYPII